MKVKINIWRFKGYAGFSDYDGPEDINIDMHIGVDARFKKDAVIALVKARYIDNRVFVCNTCTLETSFEKEIQEII